jgi:hypothetical protein
VSAVPSVTVNYAGAIAELREAERLIGEAQKKLDRCALAGMYIPNARTYDLDAGDLLKVATHQVIQLRYAFEKAQQGRGDQ